MAFIAGLYLTRPLFDFAREVSNVERCCGIEIDTDVIVAVAPFSRTGFSFAIAAGLLLFNYQVVAYVSPRLTGSGRSYACRSVPLAALCFLLGAALAFFVAIPRALEFLSSFNSDVLELSRMFGSVAELYIQVSLGVGIALELTFILYRLARLGIVSPRQMSASRRYAVVAALLAAAFFTLWPFRLGLVLLFAGAIYGLYEVGIILAKFADRRRNRQTTLDEKGISAVAG
jgi:sec-independent protein translocase protein TatC